MSSLDCQRDYWNDVGPTKTFAHPVNFERLALHLRPASRILDYGCGYGRVVGLLDERGYRNLVGVDQAPAMIEEARRRHPHLTFECLDQPPGLPFPDGSIDAVLLIAVLTCIPTDDGQQALVAEVSRVLRPGGLFYVSDLWLQQDARNRERYDRGLAKYGTYGVFELDEGVVLRHQEPQSFAALTTAYDTAANEPYVFETMNGHQAEGFQWFGSKTRGT